MLDWERWTLTHSSAGAVVSVLVLVLVLVLGLGLGLLLVGLGVAATWASSVVAGFVAAGVLDVEVDVDGAVDADDVEADGEMDADDLEADGDEEVSRDADGEAVRLGLPLSLVVGEDVVGGSLAAGLLEDEVDGDGEGEGDGDGVAVADGGRA